MNEDANERCEDLKSDEVVEPRARERSRDRKRRIYGSLPTSTWWYTWRQPQCIRAILHSTARNVCALLGGSSPHYRPSASFTVPRDALWSKRRARHPRPPGVWIRDYCVVDAVSGMVCLGYDLAWKLHLACPCQCELDST